MAARAHPTSQRGAGGTGAAPAPGTGHLLRTGSGMGWGGVRGPMARQGCGVLGTDRGCHGGLGCGWGGGRPEKQRG